MARTGPSETVVFPGLNNGTAYTFTVQAVGTAGTGAASLASNSVTPTATPTGILPVIAAPLVAWYSATQQPSPPSNGVELPTWNDLSGNGFNLTRNGGAGTGGTWVTSWSNSKPAIALNGSTQYYGSTLQLASFGPQLTVAAVFDATANAGTAAVWSNNNSNVANLNGRIDLTLTGVGPVTPTVRTGASTAVAPTFALSAPQTCIRGLSALARLLGDWLS
jgi:hypothetical protein